MRSLIQFWPTLIALAGAALAAYGGYGAGIARVAIVSTSHWLYVAAVLGTALICLGIGLWKPRRPVESPASFANDLAALERLVPKVRRHPEGLSILQDLVEILFESCHRTEASTTQDTLGESRTNGGRADV